MDNQLGKLVDISVLHEWESNPRNISTIDKARLKSQIETLGQYKPLLAMPMNDGTYIVLGGNMRLSILKEMSLQKVWISEVKFEKKEDELFHAYINGQEAPKRFMTMEDGMTEYALSDNDRAGYYDDDLLLNLIPNLNIDWTQYAVDAKPPTIIQEIIDRNKQATEDDAPALSQDPPKSKPGEIYQLGKHKLMCGDATNYDHVKALMDVPADLVFTDPPYNVNYKGRGKETSNTIKNDNMEKEQFKQLLYKSFLNMKSFARDNTPAYVCYASSSHREFEDSLNLAGYEVRNQIIWVKKVASMGWGDYRWKHEPILYVKPKEGVPDFYGDRDQYTEWTEEMSDEQLLAMMKKMIKQEELGGSTVWRLSRDSDYKHPTQKPIQLVVIAIKNSSTVDDVVVDLFAGSGTTLIACEQTERRSRVMELDPKYCDVIRKRYARWLKREAEWENLTPKIGYVQTPDPDNNPDNQNPAMAAQPGEAAAEVLS